MRPRTARSDLLQVANPPTYCLTSSSIVLTLKLSIRSFMRRSISLVAPTKRMK